MGLWDDFTSWLGFKEAEEDTQQTFPPDSEEEDADLTEAVAQCPYATEFRIGVALAFHPILFNRNEYIENESNFHVLERPLFPHNYLLADQHSEAIIEVNLVVLDDNGQLRGPGIELADVGYHAGEGTLVLELADSRCGCLQYREQVEEVLRIPLSDIPDGTTGHDHRSPDSVFFVASGQIGKTTVRARIEGECGYEYVEHFALPPESNMRLELTVGSREMSEGTEGYDVMKYQWHLRKFRFRSYTLRAGVSSRGSGNRWRSLGEIGLDGDFGGRTSRASEDFQVVSRGRFRNQATTAVGVTYNAAVSGVVNDAVVDEVEVWRDNGYTVECYHGLTEIDYDDGAGTAIDEDADIVYGALVVGQDPRGYVEVQAARGSRCHWYNPNAGFAFADAIHTAIRLFNEDDLIFRLHDADPDDLLDDTHIHSGFKDLAIAMIRAARNDQQADYAGAGNRDLRVSSGFRSVADQNVLYAQGRTAPGDIVTNAPGGWSWHNFGLAADVVFCNENGNPSWSESYDWNAKGAYGTAQGLVWGGVWVSATFPNGDRPHHQLNGVQNENGPTANVRNTYNNTAGTVQQKLQAVWTLMGV